MFEPGEVVLARMQFTDTFEIKTRPAVVLFEEFDNIVVAGVTSNLAMKGIPISAQEGMPKDSVIKLNYIFTVSRAMVSKTLCRLTNEKKKMVFDGITARLSPLSK